MRTTFSLAQLLSSATSRRNISPTRLIVSSFLGVIACGTLLLMLPVASRGAPVGFLDALFTATSATCVTGLIVFDTYTQFTLFGQVIILLLIQIGGLGLVTLTTFFNIAIGRRLGFKSLQLASESINTSDASQARRLLQFVMKTAAIFEISGAILLLFAFVPQYGSDGYFLSLFIAISAFCNAGFDLFGFIAPYGSLTHFYNNPYVLGVVSVLIISGGLGFLVWHDLAHYRETRRLRVHTKLVLVITAVLLIGGAVGMAVLEWNNPATLGAMTPFDKLTNAAFQSVTARTAGFNSIDLNGMFNMTKLFMIFLMFIGAAPGGTGGGIKITTVAVVLVAVASVVRGRQDAMIFKRRIPQKTVYKALAILILSGFAVLISCLTIFYNTGSDVNEINSVFEAVSAFATVGCSVGVTAIMNPIAKTITMLTMLIGRVGPVSMAISLSSRKDEKTRRTIAPQADITVG